MNLKSVSTRGFNSGANSRFLQLTDGVDNDAPGLGFPIGDLMGPPDLDISSMDLTVGAGSAQYASSAMSGVLHTRTKDPFDARGLTLSTKGGLHNFKLGGADPWAVSGEENYDISFRYAQPLHEKFAFKVTGLVMAGTDWLAENYDNVGYGKSSFYRDDIAGYDGANVYGDEKYVYQPIGSDEESGDSIVPVTRTGYKERDLVNYDIATRKLGLSLFYRPSDNIQLKTGGGYGYTNTIYTSHSRIRLKDFEMYQFRSELTIGSFYLRGYSTIQNSGNSYNINHLANSLLKSAKNDADWFRDFEKAFIHGVQVSGVKSNNISAARDFADSGVTLLHNSTATPRLEPGTPEFETAVHKETHHYGFKGGAGLKDNSRLFHVESGKKLDNSILGFDTKVGGSFRFYDLSSGGTIFPDSAGNDITNYEYGGFVQFEQDFFNENLNTQIGSRIDKNENFNLRTSQNFGLNYRYLDKHMFRFSYQNAFRYPTVREQFLNTSLTDARLLGGLSIITDQYNLQENSVTQQSVNAYNKAVVSDLNSNSPNIYRTQAELKNLQFLRSGILRKEELKRIKPEKTHGLEVGYRQLFTPQLYMDFNYFVSFFRDFIGIKRLVKPRTSPSEDLYIASGQVNNSLENDHYFVYSNARDWVTTQGVSFDIKYKSGSFFSGLNGTWTQLIKNSSDPIIPGFNTPPLKINFEWGNREITKNIGFKMIFRGRSKYDWQSSFLDGQIDGYGHFDFQVTVRIPTIDTTVKTGFTNMGVESYYDNFGGPAIGSIIFTTLTFSP